MAELPRRRDRVLDAVQVLLGHPAAPSAAREDANAIGQSVSGAAVRNELSGLGGIADSGAMARPNVDRHYLDEQELIAMLRGTLYRRICQLPPWEAMRKGWHLSDDTDDEQPLAKAMRQHRVRQKLRAAATWGRALGEARVWLAVEDGRHPSEPLEIERVKRVYQLHVLDAREFTPATWQTSPRESTDLGMPETYFVHPRRMGMLAPTTRVHHTRLLRFYGDELPPSEMGSSGAGMGYADAVGQTLWDGLRNLASTNAAGAKLAQELSVAVFYLGKVEGKDTGRDRDGFRDKLSRLIQMKSLVNAIFLGTGDRAERLTAQASGFGNLSEDAWMYLQAKSSIPAALLRGMAPSGLNADGESWQKAWYSFVGGYREDQFRDPLEVLVQLFYMQELGTVPDTWTLTFPDLHELSETEKAQVRLTTAQADRIALEDNLVTPDQVRRSRYGDGGWNLELQAPTEEDLEELASGASRKSVEEITALLAGGEGEGEEGGQEAEPTTEPKAKAEPEPEPQGQGSGQSSADPTGEPRPEAKEFLVGDKTTVAELLKALNRGEMTREQVQAQLEIMIGTTPEEARKLIAEPMTPPPRGDAQDADFTGKALLSVQLSEAGREAWADLVRQVEAITGPLEGYDPGEAGIQEAPHVTVLYLGEVSEQALTEVVAVAREEAARFAPLPLRTCAVHAFEPGPHSEDRYPIVAAIEAWALRDLNDRLVRRLAHVIEARQFPEFSPHVTLGFAPALSAEARVGLAELLGHREVEGSAGPRSMGAVGELVLQSGGKVVARLPFTGTRVDQGGGGQPEGR